MFEIQIPQNKTHFWNTGLIIEHMQVETVIKMHRRLQYMLIYVYMYDIYPSRYSMSLTHCVNNPKTFDLVWKAFSDRLFYIRDNIVQTVGNTK